MRAIGLLKFFTLFALFWALMPVSAASPEAAAGCAALGAAVTEPQAARGIASWYGDWHHGKPTASGERFDMHELTAAHKTLPFGTWVRVSSPTTGREVTVRINDRGALPNRIIDLSRAAADQLGMTARGIKRVVLTVLGSEADAADCVPGRPTRSAR